MESSEKYLLFLLPNEKKLVTLQSDNMASRHACVYILTTPNNKQLKYKSNEKNLGCWFNGSDRLGTYERTA